VYGACVFYVHVDGFLLKQKRNPRRRRNTQPKKMSISSWKKKKKKKRKTHKGSRGRRHRLLPRVGSGDSAGALRVCVHDLSSLCLLLGKY
jgi:hypothetical protein